MAYIVILAKEIFTTDDSKSDDNVNISNFNQINMIKGLSLFINQSVKKIIKNESLDSDVFREKKLYTPEVRLLFSMNQVGLR